MCLWASLWFRLPKTNALLPAPLCSVHKCTKIPKIRVLFCAEILFGYCNTLHTHAWLTIWINSQRLGGGRGPHSQLGDLKCSLKSWKEGITGYQTCEPTYPLGGFLFSKVWNFKFLHAAKLFPYKKKRENVGIFPKLGTPSPRLGMSCLWEKWFILHFRTLGTFIVGGRGLY